MRADIFHIGESNGGQGLSPAVPKGRRAKRSKIRTILCIEKKK